MRFHLPEATEQANSFCPREYGDEPTKLPNAKFAAIEFQSGKNDDVALPQKVSA